MNPADIICIYIYESLKILQASLTVLISSAQAILKKLNTFLDAMFNLMRYTIDVAVSAILDAVRVFQKYLCDLIFSLDMSAFCTNLYKCNIFIEQLTDPTSLIFRTLKQMGIDLSKEQALANSLISDYTQFKNQICDFGFTFNFGLSAIKSLLKTYTKILNGWIDVLYKKKEEARRYAQKYLDYCSNSGIFDALDKLMKFFNCVITGSDLCASVDTSKSFYADVLAKLNIEEEYGSYKLNKKLSNKIYDAFDTRTAEMENVKYKMNDMIEELLAPSQVKAASNAFNIAKNIFPGGMSWTDIKKGRFSKNAAVSYFSGKISDIKELFVNKKSNDSESIYSNEYILENSTVSEDGKTYTLNDNGKTITVENKNTEEIKIPDTVIAIDNVVKNELFIDKISGKVYSTYAAGYIAATDPESNITKQINKTISNLSSFISEEELVKAW